MIPTTSEAVATVTRRPTSRSHRRHRPDSRPNDRALVTRIRAGDDAAFVLLASRYHSEMVMFAESCIPGPAAAEDVVMEAWMGALDGLAEIGDEPVKLWLFRLLGATALRRTCDHQVDFDASAESAAGASLRDALARLPVAERQVVTLRDVAGWTRDEICELLSLSSAAYLQLLHAGRSAVCAMVNPGAVAS